MHFYKKKKILGCNTFLQKIKAITNIVVMKALRIQNTKFVLFKLP